VVKTLLRGKPIYDADEGILATPGYGKFLRRTSDDGRRTNDDGI
jgi:hypothetical protein